MPKHARLNRTHKLTAAGIASAGAAALVFAAVPGSADAGQSDSQVQPVAATAADDAAARAQFAELSQRAEDVAENAITDANNAKRQAEADAAKAAAKAKAEAEAKAKREREAKEAASRAAKRKQVQSYPNNLDGWIRESLAIMKREGIPGSYEGIKRNIMRESGGDPRAINNWDINAVNGVPSKGLLQVIKPTFDAYHVDGTAWDQYDPVANITAACNYAADRYGSMDNVNSAY